MKKQQTAIGRAKERATQWEAQADEWRRRPSYLRLSAMELIELAERRGLGAEELEALDEAGFAMFGETLTIDAETSATAHAEPETEPEQQSEQQDDRPVSGWKAAAGRRVGAHAPARSDSRSISRATPH